MPRVSLRLPWALLGFQPVHLLNPKLEFLISYICIYIY